MKGLVYLNHKELNPDLMLKAFNTYVLAIYLYHAPIIILQEKKFKLLEQRMQIQLKKVMLKKSNKWNHNLLITIGIPNLEYSADIQLITNL